MTDNIFGFEGFFDSPLENCDKEIYKSITDEAERQNDGIELIASENIVSKSVLQAMGSVFTNKYAEGYPAKRYYGGCEYADVMEDIAISRAKKLFGCEYANVQPHSGSQANQAVFMALLKPGDVIMGLSLASGGHLTHGAAPNQSGKWFTPVSYEVNAEGLIDYDAMMQTAKEHKPKLLIAGGSAYARRIDFAFMRKVADEVGAYLLVDMAHFAGLVATGHHPHPFPHADVVTTTTHKTLRAARGGMVLTNNEEIAKKVNSAIFPGLQGGPLLHAIAGKAAGFGEALRPEFKQYIGAVVENASVLSKVLTDGGLAIVSGGTDTHLMLVDLRPMGVTGNVAEKALERAHITCNKNSIPQDPEKPTVTSGVRLGTPAATSRGFGADEFRLVGDYILRVLRGLSESGGDANEAVEASVRAEVQALCSKFPLYPNLY